MKKLSCLVLTIVMLICGVMIPKSNYSNVQASSLSITGNIKNTEYAKTPFGKHGKLKVKGKYIVDKNGKRFQIKGVSSHGINWDVGYPFVNITALQNLRDEWGVNCFRIAMYTEEYNGYCVTDDNSRKQLISKIDEAVNATKELGMYVIIDWHILSDGNPNNHKKEAKHFFDSMSSKYKNYSNVIYEICNEPNGNVSWNNIKAYANEIIPVIRANSSNIIIVGTPNWSQDVDVAAKSKIEGQKNIAYAFHFYAATHKKDFRKKLKSAYKHGLPIVCTEFSACEASGNGNYDFNSANKWLKLFDKYHIGYSCWSLSNKNEASALLKSNCKKTSGFTDKDISKMGLWIISKYTK